MPALAEKLGYKLGKSGEEQREFWTAVSIRAIYHLPLDPSAWPRTGSDSKPALPPKLRVDLRNLRR